MSVICFFLNGCAYKLSSNFQALPGDVKIVHIPLFKNESTEVGIETFFTNALKQEALRSKFVELRNEAFNSEAILQGKIVGVEAVADESVIEAKNTQFLPTETVIATQYRVTAIIELVLYRKETMAVLWRGNFTQTGTYSAPQITLPVINTANSLYNQSAKRQTLDALSKDMMQAAFDRMVENF